MSDTCDARVAVWKFRLLLHIGQLGQIAIGIATGVAIALLVNTLDWTGVVVVAAFMFAVGVASAVGPARRGLRIQPTEALKAE